MKKQLAIIGIGMGNADTLTVEARRFIDNAGLLIGASRMLETVAGPKQNCIAEYRAEAIREILFQHEEAERIAVLMSGDIGFYSGTAGLLREIGSEIPGGRELLLMPGISSLIYFAARLQMPWHDIVITTSHGRSCSLISEINHASKVFSILGTDHAARDLCEQLIAYDMDNCVVHIGQNFGYDEEAIYSGHPSTLLNKPVTALSVVIVENPDPLRTVAHGIKDEEFLRDKVPMTKEEVREISLSKLRLKRDSVVYDIGAGSGSVSIEAALTAYRGRIYAIEKNPVAVDLLRRNRMKFKADNLTIVEGLAPEALNELPIPTHAFIGGSSGNMREIVELLLRKNPDIRLVINAITLETVQEGMQVLEDFGFREIDIVSVSAAKSKKVGSYHMMMGQNPVYIMSGTGSSGN